MARTQRNSNYRRSNEYQSDRGNPVWLLFFFDRLGKRGKLSGHDRVTVSICNPEEMLARSK